MAIIIVTLTGCDPVYGIRARKIITQPPDDSCILAALKQTHGVKGVQTQTLTNQGWLVAGDGPLHGTPIRYFTYDIGGQYSPTLMIEGHGTEQFEYSDIMLSMHQKIPQSQIDHALPIMIEAEKQLSRSCGVDLVDGMKHFCDGSHCGL